MTAHKTCVVFVIGAPRSGTSVIGRAVTRSLRALEYSEGHMLPLLADWMHDLEERFSEQDARKFQGMLAEKLSIDDLRSEYLEMVRRLYARAYADGPIVDKTPSFDAIRAIPFVRTAFPGCHVVFCYRRALENVASCMRKWPDVPFKNHCYEWTAIMAAWRTLRDTLPNDCYTEIEQLDIVRRTKFVAKALVDGIGCNARRKVLLEELGSQFSMIEGSKVGRIQSLETVDWSDEQRADFKDICGDELQQWGYSLDESYTTHPNTQGFDTGC